MHVQLRHADLGVAVLPFAWKGAALWDPEILLIDEALYARVTEVHAANYVPLQITGFLFAQLYKDFICCFHLLYGECKSCAELLLLFRHLLFGRLIPHHALSMARELSGRIGHLNLGESVFEVHILGREPKEAIVIFM